MSALILSAACSSSEPDTSTLPGTEGKATPSRSAQVPDVTLLEEPKGELLVGAWELVELRNNQQEVVLRFHAEEGCSTFLGVLVREGPEEVVLAPLARRRETVGAGPQLCPGTRTDGVGYVRLAESLGDRELQSLPADF